MNHQRVAGAAVMLIERIWITEVEREMEAAIGIHLRGRDSVKAFGSLVVAFLLLWPEDARVFADWVSTETFVAVVFLDPDLEAGRIFENADEHGIAELKVLFGEVSDEFGFDAFDGIARARTRWDNFGGHFKGERGAKNQTQNTELHADSECALREVGQRLW